LTQTTENVNNNNNNKKRKLQKAVKRSSSFKQKFDLFRVDNDDEDDETIPLVKPIDFKIIINNNDKIGKCLECGNPDLETHFT
jgi:hypothetical protein